MEIQKDNFPLYKPSNDPKIKGDAMKTLFIGRLSYDTKESDLERELGRFGPIERIRIVKDETQPQKGKKAHRGYAFIVYEREKDMRGNTFFDFLCKTPTPLISLTSSPRAFHMVRLRELTHIW